MPNNLSILRQPENLLPMLLVPAAAISFYMASAPLAESVIGAYNALTAPRVVVIYKPAPTPVPSPLPTPTPVPVQTHAPIPAPAPPRPAPPRKLQAPKITHAPKCKRPIPKEVLAHRSHIVDGWDDMVEQVDPNGSRAAYPNYPLRCSVLTPEQIANGTHCAPGPVPQPLYGPIFYDEYCLAHSHAY